MLLGVVVRLGAGWAVLLAREHGQLLDVPVENLGYACRLRLVGRQRVHGIPEAVRLLQRGAPHDNRHRLFGLRRGTNLNSESGNRNVKEWCTVTPRRQRKNTRGESFKASTAKDFTFEVLFLRKYKLLIVKDSAKPTFL